MPLSVFAFDDFSSFFRARCEEWKTRDERFSYRWLARRIGLKSHTYLVKVASGEQAPSLEVCRDLCAQLELSVEEATYARAIAQVQAAKSPNEREYFVEKAMRLKPGQAVTPLLPSEHSLLRTWLNVALLELIGQSPLDDEPDRIAERFRPDVSIDDIVATLAALETLGFISRDKAGLWRREVGNVSSSHNVAKEEIRGFHKQMLVRAAESIERDAVTERCILSQCLAIAPERLGEAEALLVEFRTRFSQTLRTNGGEIFHLGLQLVPLTKPPKKTPTQPKA